jgi:DNA-binding protein HU-beta
VNKAELIEALSGRLGDRKSATAALDAVLAEIQNAVTKGDKVSITGFGVFEKRVRAARTARNPRTGESVKVKKTSVPAFRPGAGFKELVAAGKLPKATPAAKKAAAAPSKRAAAAPAKKAVKATTVKKAAPAKKAAKATKAATAPARSTRNHCQKAPANNDASSRQPQTAHVQAGRSPHR